MDNPKIYTKTAGVKSCSGGPIAAKAGLRNRDFAGSSRAATFEGLCGLRRDALEER